jgi:hypothetical protein
MLAAALLAAALATTYAVIGAISLTSVSGTGNIAQLTTLVKTAVGSVAFAPPSAHDIVAPSAGAAGVTSPSASGLQVDLGRVTGAAMVSDALRLTNTSSIPQTVRLSVLGAPGLQALFGASGTSALRLASGEQASVDLVTSPLHAGQITGLVQVEVGTAGTYTVPVTAVQAPLPPTGLVATPAAGGAVDLAWTPSPSTGVGGYTVYRAAAPGGPWTAVGRTAAPAFHDPVDTNGATEYYQVVATAAGVSPPLGSPPSATASAVTDSQPPAAPTGITVPVINIANEDAVPVTVDLPAGSASTDTITVTMTDGANSASAQAAGGQAQVVILVDASDLADGPIGVSVTLTDAIGNSAAFSAQTVKDTVAPGPPVAVALTTTPANTINVANQSAVPVTVTVPAAVESGATVRVQLASGGQTVQASAVAAAGSDQLTVDATSLPDGAVTVTAWIVDAAGNPSPPVTGPAAVKDTGQPAPPSSFTAPAGADNPAGYVNIATQHAALFTAVFAQPTPAGGTVTLTVAGQTFQFPGGQAAYTVGPLDVSAQPDGPLALTGTVSNGAGNVTAFTGQAVKDTVDPSGPESFGVAAGPANPAGYVNLATEHAAVIQAQFADPTATTDTLDVHVSGLDLGAESGGSSTIGWTSDLSGLPDGTLALVGTITDAAGNTTHFFAHAIKDTVPPPAPISARVLGWPPGVILDRNAGCVTVKIRFGGGVPVGDSLVANLTGGGVTVGGEATVHSPYQYVHCIDARPLPNGTVTLSGTITDAAGNVTTWQGTAAVKRR